MKILIISILLTLFLVSNLVQTNAVSINIDQNPSKISQSLSGFQMNIFPATGSWFNVQTNNLKISVISQTGNQILKKYSFDCSFDLYLSQSGDWGDNYIQFQYQYGYNYSIQGQYNNILVKNQDIISAQGQLKFTNLTSMYPLINATFFFYKNGADSIYVWRAALVFAFTELNNFKYKILLNQLNFQRFYQDSITSQYGYDVLTFNGTNIPQFQGWGSSGWQMIPQQQNKITLYSSNPSNANLTFQSVYYYPNSNIPNISETDTVVLNYSIVNQSYYNGSGPVINYQINNNIVQNMNIQAFWMANYSYSPTPIPQAWFQVNNISINYNPPVYNISAGRVYPVSSYISASISYLDEEPVSFDLTNNIDPQSHSENATFYFDAASQAKLANLQGHNDSTINFTINFNVNSTYVNQGGQQYYKIESFSLPVATIFDFTSNNNFSGQTSYNYDFTRKLGGATDFFSFTFGFEPVQNNDSQVSNLSALSYTQFQVLLMFLSIFLLFIFALY